MNISLGIVGLPNVGKSSLFNALTKKVVPAENYPFCTIDPNVGVVAVHDKRLEEITKVINPQEEIPAVVEFVDIAGLVRGASKGEGLGNQFLSHIREVSAIVHVLRKFSASEILHVEESVDPLRDMEIINTELILKDMETVDKRLQGLERQARADKKLLPVVEHLQLLKSHLDGGLLAYDLPHSTADEAVAARKELQLLTDKPVLYLLNVEQENAEEAVAELRKVLPAEKLILPMDVQLESELIDMTPEEREEYMSEFNLKETGLEKLTREAYSLLGLISYFTAGEKETRAWTIVNSWKAPLAAGAIHTDFTKNFIAADVVSYNDFITDGGWEGAKAAGHARLEGKEYIVRDGDVVLFRIGKG